VTKNALSVRNVNTEEAVAWKNGDFIFDDEDFGSILRQVARWYNVEMLTMETTKIFIKRYCITLKKYFGGIKSAGSYRKS